MARKLQFNTAIMADIQSAAADSFIDNLIMVDIDDIEENEENFYNLSEIEMLADDIERQGLKQNLVIIKNPDNAQKPYKLIGGHRRCAALRLLIEQNRRNSKKVPCYLEGETSPTVAKMNLIMLNAMARKYTDAERIQEYDELVQLYDQLEAEGKPIKGRLRENIAKALNISPAQVGKIENIKHNAIPQVEEAVKGGELSISTANELAKLPEHKQQEIISSKPASEISHKDVAAEVKEFKTEPPTTTDIDDDFDEADELLDVDIAAPQTAASALFDDCDDDNDSYAANEEVKSVLEPTITTQKSSDIYCSLTTLEVVTLLPYMDELLAGAKVQDRKVIEDIICKLCNGN